MKTRQIPIEELARLPGRALFNPSHDRRQMAYYSNHTGRFELYQMDLRTKEARQVTDGTAPRALRAPFVWGQDDRTIIFAKDREGDEQNNLYLLDLTSGTVTQLNDDRDTQEYVVDVFPDNRTVLVVSNRDDQQSLYRFDTLSRNWQRLTCFKAPVGGGIVSPDGTQIAFSGNESPNLQNFDVYLMQADGDDIRKVWSLEEGSQELVVGWHPSGESLLVQSDASGTLRIGVLALNTCQVRWLSEQQGDLIDGEFSRDGRHIVVLENNESQIRPVLYRADTGERHLLNLPAGVASLACFVLDDRKLLMAYSSASRRGEVLLYDVDSGTHEVLLAAEYGRIDPALFVGNEHVWYSSADHRMVPAILYRPRNIPAGSRLPAIVDVHGGPTAQYFRGFNNLAQLLVDRGYVVIQPNFRGSTGYGREWRESNHMDWGGGDLSDVVASVDYLKNLNLVDPDRIAIFGGSYGGYLTYLAAVKNPAVFKVALPWVGITDLLQLYAEDMEHFRYYLRQNMGDPREHEALWQERSAITYADQLRAKLLMVHGVNDPRCPIGQARGFRDRLLDRGLREGTDVNADFEYIELADEGHGAGGDPSGTVRMFRLVTDFLDRRL